ncbi:MAG TPA: indolepyruvate ferredoxin oxidoreductase subunit alpha [Candidatus Ornithocaccomicrobium faecavium]|uniref:Indolepyruvate oxidoreductase subunit IorA n=1 Tax=Candidatus Ornithocaccomicrobium faecavium TaxID=2840890 RepID=A0A9D1TD97_9FIRM|nr:indolepyruvate ferredoxin oxidoreductase subunit alpha [Clostridiales bacterium]HIV28511.1 indolepyruvate ferredoxin oxidoreductase subunit alpha [Candidatus Ornithocaccomicrobium faecavium]
MRMELLMGNEAIALGALAAGVQLVCGYPGTPSTEVLETVAKRRPEGVYVEWSVNEKAALEVAAGAALAGARAMVTMKQVGLNVASDPLMSLNYLGVEGGALVVLVADDPGPISSQTEQDTRHFGRYARIPVFDPQTPEQAYQMAKDALACSEKWKRPVILRPTTRVCHSCASVAAEPPAAPRGVRGFAKSEKWVIFPRLAYAAKKRLVAEEEALAAEFSRYAGNRLYGEGRLGIAMGGVAAAYAREAGFPARYLEIATPYPFPEELALSFLREVDAVLALEELDPVIEDALTRLCGKHHLPVRILGKHTGHVPVAGELSVESVRAAMAAFLGREEHKAAASAPLEGKLPVRPPVLCAGCPHRGSFYAVKQAMKGQKAVFCGDIGCYTLGNAAPLNMVDTCLCMGAGVTMAQGIARMEKDTTAFAFIGDSTFFHTGIPGVVNAIYNGADEVIVVLDNSTTAMTGRQPHPGTGATMMGGQAAPMSIPKVLEGLGVPVWRASAFDLQAAKAAIAQAAALRGRVRAVVLEGPCVSLVKGAKPLTVDREACLGCRRCVRELGCPALFMQEGKAQIDASLCTGCTLCQQVCPVNCLKGGAGRE